MNLTRPKVEELKQGPGIEGVFQMIELAGRTCYKSDDMITADSAKAFVYKLIANGHGAMLEHGTVYLKLKWYQFKKIWKYFFSPYTESNKLLYVTTNYRVIVENGWQGDLEQLCEPTEYHAMRRTFRVTCDIGVSREFNRHRANSIAEQSTRFCNYSKEKFGHELKITLPTELVDKLPDLDNCKRILRDYMDYKRVDTNGLRVIDYWFTANAVAEYCYMNLIALGWKPQQARRVLPLDTTTELVHTAFEHQWEHFLNLRCAPNAHPDMIEIANAIKSLL